MDTGRYKCLNCNGEGKVIKSGPECNDYVASCTHCGGSGLRQITVSLKEFEQNRESGGVVTDRRGLTDEETESRAIKAIGRAMEALEKQVPKEPIRQSTWRACPVCTLGIGVNDKTPNPGAIRYCYHCGQRLSWGK